VVALHGAGTTYTATRKRLLASDELPAKHMA
jgi:hypothetical protein